ncbi:acetate uptake transporter [Thermogutta sp.]|uniref:acetate uptake transporter n=1 Tax=Thermogutta sp. TaxID=1962930 RepID=UPI00321FDC47
MSEKPKILEFSPGIIGLLGFALTTIALSLYNANLIPTAGLTIGFAIFWGGMGQVFAGWIAFRQGDTFGGTAFMTYGLFWLGLALFFLLQLPHIGAEFGAWMLMWGILTLIYAATSIMLKARVLSVVLVLLTITFFMLSGAYYSGNPAVLHAAGYMGLITGIAALYLGLAIFLNSTSKRKLVPE